MKQLVWGREFKVIVRSSSHSLPHFINLLPIISFFPHQPDILHALAHCLLEPAEFSRVVMYSPLTFFLFHPLFNFIISFIVFSLFVIYHMHQLLSFLSSNIIPETSLLVLMSEGTCYCIT